MHYIVVEYKIISGENEVEVQARVNELLNPRAQGVYSWYPSGSLVIEKDGFMYQPMIRVFNIR